MIFYFSGTGNTRWAAARIAKAANDRLVFIPDVIDGDCVFEVKDENIGFVFPVHGWRPPKLVREFISKLTIKPQLSSTTPQPRIYALCTAGDSIGKTMEILEKDLQAKGLHLDAAYSLIMPESYVGLPFMDVDPKERERKKLKKAEEDLERIITLLSSPEWDTVVSHVAGNTKQSLPKGRDGEGGALHRGPLPWLFSGPIGAFFVKRLVTDKPFHVETDRCILCGKCAEVCPVHDITGGKGKSPEWLHNGRCLTCFTCYHHCPTHAIEFGRRTKSKGQYYFKNKN